MRRTFAAVAVFVLCALSAGCSSSSDKPSTTTPDTGPGITTARTETPKNTLETPTSYPTLNQAPPPAT